MSHCQVHVMKETMHVGIFAGRMYPSWWGVGDFSELIVCRTCPWSSANYWGKPPNNYIYIIIIIKKYILMF